MMRAGEPSRAFDDLCAMVCDLLRSPHALISGAAPVLAPPPRQVTPMAPLPRRTAPPQQVTPMAFASLLLGASLALMLCGSVTFVIGCILMPWVIGLFVLLYFVGIMSSLSAIGRAIVCPNSKDMRGQFLPKFKII